MTDIEGQVRRAYAGRAAEYTRLLGDIAHMDELDRDRISGWALQIDGPVIDAGCGPGHWTDFLHQRGVDICGVDFVPEFIFEGAAAEPFQHAVTEALYWSVPRMRALLENAGFKVIDTEMRRDEGGRRPNAAMTATAL